MLCIIIYVNINYFFISIPELIMSDHFSDTSMSQFFISLRNSVSEMFACSRMLNVIVTSLFHLQVDENEHGRHPALLPSLEQLSK
jgi:hypothetical protein